MFAVSIMFLGLIFVCVFHRFDSLSDALEANSFCPLDTPFLTFLRPSTKIMFVFFWFSFLTCC